MSENKLPSTAATNAATNAASVVTASTVAAGDGSAHSVIHDDLSLRRTPASEDLFNASSPRIREDIIRIIIQYLGDEGLDASKLTLSDEANVRWRENNERVTDLRRLRQAILEGDWAEVDLLLLGAAPATGPSSGGSGGGDAGSSQSGGVQASSNQSALADRQSANHPSGGAGLPGVRGSATASISGAVAAAAAAATTAAALAGGGDVNSTVAAAANMMGSTGAPSVIQMMFRAQPSFLYAVYRQQFLEHIEHHETQKAFTCLNKRLKPLEHLRATPDEFRDLCYLLSAKSVQDAPSFRHWEGIMPARQKLAERLQSMVDLETWDSDTTAFMPPHRLLTLLRQAVAYQIDRGNSGLSQQRNHNGDNSDGGDSSTAAALRVNTLLANYEHTVIPRVVVAALNGHSDNIKRALFIGEQGRRVLTCSSDSTIRLWDTAPKPAPSADHSNPTTDGNSGMPSCIAVLRGHRGRVWSISASKRGDLVASASADRTVRIWDIADAQRARSIAQFSGHQGDVYTVAMHPGARHAVSGGYDRTLRLHDINTSQLVAQLSGPESAVTAVAFNPIGNLIASGSKDAHIRFHDVASGVCIRVIPAHGEITSVTLSGDGQYLLAATKYSTNILFDLRTMRAVQRYTGHANVIKHFISASFVGDRFVAGGSEDGKLYLWHRDSGQIVRTLDAHRGTVYGADWHAERNILCTFGDDQVVRLWRD
ncbi:WD40 repeat-like protein [Ramicandelaber brevisporus]|nr:WD40 repeat-like protein [Ramicandelaber brevisporus]